MKEILLLALAGALGTLSRYALSSAISLLGGAFPLGIFITNIAGCFLFGAVWAMASLFHLFSDATRLLLLTGFMGSFTTFSSFIFDSKILLDNGQWFSFAFNICGQIILGIIALLLGIKTVSHCFS